MIEEKMYDKPRLFVAKGKHSKEYWVINSNLDLLRAKVRMVQGWHDNGYFYAPSEPRVSEQDAPIVAMTSEQVKALPEPFKAQAISIRRRHRAAIAEYEDAKEINELVKQIIDAPTVDDAIAVKDPAYDRPAVSTIVDAFDGHEYMGWNTERISSLI